MDTNDLFGKLKDTLGEFKMPDNPQKAYDDVSEIWKSDEDISGKLSKLKDQFFTKEEENKEDSD